MPEEPASSIKAAIAKRMSKHEEVGAVAQATSVISKDAGPNLSVPTNALTGMAPMIGHDLAKSIMTPSAVTVGRALKSILTIATKHPFAVMERVPFPIERDWSAPPIKAFVVAPSPLIEIGREQNKLHKRQIVLLENEIIEARKTKVSDDRRYAITLAIAVVSSATATLIGIWPLFK
jgi:hypothetical protein